MDLICRSCKKGKIVETGMDDSEPGFMCDTCGEMYYSTLDAKEGITADEADWARSHHLMK